MDKSEALNIITTLFETNRQMSAEIATLKAALEKYTLTPRDICPHYSEVRAADLIIGGCDCKGKLPVYNCSTCTASEQRCALCNGLDLWTQKKGETHVNSK